MQYKVIIPARGGSKRIPRKNLKNLGGKPLIQWTIDYSFTSGFCPYVLSDDPEINQLATDLGCFVIHEPTEIADDYTPMVDVFRYFHQVKGPCHIILLQPTYPYRRPGLIHDCVRTFENEVADVVYVAAPVKFFLVTREGKLINHAYDDQGRIPRTQCVDQQYLHSGAVGVIRSDIVPKMTTSIFGKYSLVEVSIFEVLQDLDTLDDWNNLPKILRLLNSPISEG